MVFRKGPRGHYVRVRFGRVNVGVAFGRLVADAGPFQDFIAS